MDSTVLKRIQKAGANQIYPRMEKEPLEVQVVVAGFCLFQSDPRLHILLKAYLLFGTHQGNTEIGHYLNRQRW